MIDMIKEIEAHILRMWLETGTTPTIDELITAFAITDDIITKDELTTILVESDDDEA